MKHFEEYILAERRNTAERMMENTDRRVKRQMRRRFTREERRIRTRETLAKVTAFLLLAMLVVIISILLTTPTESAEIQAEPTAARITMPVQEDFENEKIEAALYDSGYFRSDIPLDGDTQALLRAACEESGIEYELALAVIEQETGYQNVTGDNGQSAGYMQVQEKWHGARMERLGVTDLTDPFGNFRVGCDYLSELLSKYSLAEALTAYNSGKPGNSAYADEVRARLERLRA